MEEDRKSYGSFLTLKSEGLGISAHMHKEVSRCFSPPLAVRRGEIPRKCFRNDIRVVTNRFSETARESKTKRGKA